MVHKAYREYPDRQARRVSKALWGHKVYKALPVRQVPKAPLVLREQWARQEVLDLKVHRGFRVPPVLRAFKDFKVTRAFKV